MDKSAMKQQRMPQIEQIDNGKNPYDHSKHRNILNKRAQMSGYLPQTHGKAHADEGNA